MRDNPFEHFWRLGYRRLVPIVPPDAPISARSTLHKRVGTPQDGRGKTPGIRHRDGLWSGFDWLPYEADERDVARWHGMGAGVGIKTGQGLVAIDADTPDTARARVIKETVEQRLGLLPIRVGNYPKALYVCRVDAPFTYARVEFGARDDKNRLTERVEILSDGRQFVAHGTHPKTGKPYTWPREIVPFAELPTVTPQQLTDLLTDLRTKLPAASEIVREGAVTDVNQDALKGPLDAVRRAVTAVPNTSALFPSREAYRDMGYAIKAALPDDEPAAFDIFADWCGRWDDGANDPDIVAADWKRMKGPFRRGASWLYELAERHGGKKFSLATVWFDEVEESASPFAEISLNPLNATDASLYPVLDIGDILNRPPPRWLLARHIPVQGVGFLYSEPGVGKSFLALDMALHIAYGRADWHGDAIDAADDAVVLYLAAEGSYGFRNRIKAWLKHRGIPGDQAKRFKMIEQTVNFMAPEDVDRLLRTVKLAIRQRPCLIVVDTVSRAMPGADENLQKEMTLFVRACDTLRDAFSCAVMGVHHAGKNGDMRGSTVLLGAGDFVFRLARKKGATVGQLGCEKQKDGPDGWEEPYRFDCVTLGDGETSLVVDRAEMGVGPDAVLTPGTAAAVLGAMAAAWDEGEPWSAAPQSGERRAVRRLVNDFGFGAIQAEETLRMWEASGLIRVETASSHSKRKGYKVLADPDSLSRQDGIFA